MKSLLPFIALSVAWYAPAAGQIKPLVQKGTIATTLTFDYASFALPTACDDKGRSYLKLWKGNGSRGPVFRVSDKGVIEAQFDSPEMLGNTFAVRPDAGIVTLIAPIGKGGMPYLGKTNVIDNFGPDGARESQVRLETSLIPFFPMQIAVFPSGGFFLAGQQDQADKPSAAVYDPEGHLLKQLDWEGTDEERHAVNGSDDKAAAATRPERSIAITGDDGYVYFMRPMSPPSIYVISSAGEIVRKLVVKSPVGTSWGPDFGLRVVENRLLVEFHRDCQTPYDEILALAKVEIDPSCGRKLYTIVDATTGERIGDFEPDPRASGPIACYVPNPDRFYTFSVQDEGHRLEMIEAGPK